MTQITMRSRLPRVGSRIPVADSLWKAPVERRGVGSGSILRSAVSRFTASVKAGRVSEDESL